MRFDVYEFNPPREEAYFWIVVWEETKPIAFVFVLENDFYFATGHKEFMRLSKSFNAELQERFLELFNHPDKVVDFRGFKLQLVGLVPGVSPYKAYILTKEDKKVFILFVKEGGFIVYGPKGEILFVAENGFIIYGAKDAEDIQDFLENVLNAIKGGMT